MPVPTSDMCTKNIGSFPEPLVLLRRCVAFAFLGEIASSGYEAWIKRELDIDVRDHEPSATFEWDQDIGTLWFDNQQGDSFAVWFRPDGVLVCGFAHEYPMSPYAGDDHEVWPDMFDGLPPAMMACVQSTLYADDITFCVWWTPQRAWQRGVKHYDADPWYVPDPDGSGYLLEPLGASDAACAEYWAHDYGEMLTQGVATSSAVVLRAEGELTDELVRQINPSATLERVRSIATRLGYGDLQARLSAAWSR